MKVQIITVLGPSMLVGSIGTQYRVDKHNTTKVRYCLSEVEGNIVVSRHSNYRIEGPFISDFKIDLLREGRR